MSSFASSMRLKNKSTRSSSSSGGNSNALFPLPEGFFPKVTLTRAQIQRYEHQMQHIVRDALVAYERHEAMGDRPAYVEPWRWLNSVENLIAVQHAASNSSSNSRSTLRATPTTTRIFGRVNGDFRQLMDFFYAETSKELFDWNNALFGNTVDAAVLCNIHTAASRGPCAYMGIKWVCVSAPRILKRKRDQCFLEYIVYTTDTRGRDVGIRVDLPIELPVCPPLPKELGVKRVQTHSVMILRAATNDSNATEIFVTTETDATSSASSAGYYKRLMAVLKDMALSVDSRRIAQQAIVDRDAWVSRADRDACATCKRAFHATRRHHHCRLCGEVICSSCAIVRMARRRGQKTPQKTKVCLQCVTAIRESDAPSVAELALSGSTVATASNCMSTDVLQRSGLTSSSSSNVTKRQHRHYPLDRAVSSSFVSDSDVETSDWESDSDFEFDGHGSSTSSYSRSSSMRSVSFDGDFDTNGRRSSGSTATLSESSTGSSSASSSTSSSFASTRGDKQSFATRLDVIQDQFDESSEPLVDFSADLACLRRTNRQGQRESERERDDVEEVLDTKRMAKASSLLLSALPEQTLLVPGPSRIHPSPVTAAMMGSSSISSRASSRANSTSSGSLRSIDRCLAEQEELLKRMVLVANTSRTSSNASMS